MIDIMNDWRDRNRYQLEQKIESLIDEANILIDSNPTIGLEKLQLANKYFSRYSNSDNIRDKIRYTTKLYSGHVL